MHSIEMKHDVPQLYGHLFSAIYILHYSIKCSWHKICSDNGIHTLAKMTIEIHCHTICGVAAEKKARVIEEDKINVQLGNKIIKFIILIWITKNSLQLHSYSQQINFTQLETKAKGQILPTAVVSIYHLHHMNRSLHAAKERHVIVTDQDNSTLGDLTSKNWCSF